MTISVVNGYICTSCSDVSKAKKGENPHPQRDAGAVDGQGPKGSGRAGADDPAVTFGGHLAELFGLRRVDPASDAAAVEAPFRTLGAKVDLTV